MSRYKVVSPWSNDDLEHPPYEWHDYDTDKMHVARVQSADIQDTKNGSIYREGAKRTVIDGKPFKTGKGGTIPHFGEMAWASAARDFDDLVFAQRRKGW